MEAIRAIERKSDLETLVFERKMALLKETTEKTEAKLYAAQTLSSDEAARDNASRKLEVQVTYFSTFVHFCTS